MIFKVFLPLCNLVGLSTPLCFSRLPSFRGVYQGKNDSFMVDSPHNRLVMQKMFSCPPTIVCIGQANSKPGVIIVWTPYLIYITFTIFVGNQVELLVTTQKIPAWISNDMPSKVWDEIAYPFLNFNGCTVEVYEWISNFIPHFMMDVITYPFGDLKIIHVSKRGHILFFKSLLWF